MRSAFGELMDSRKNFAKKLALGLVLMGILFVMFVSAAHASGGCTITTYPNGSKLISCHSTHSTPIPSPTPTATVSAIEVPIITVPSTGGATP